MAQRLQQNFFPDRVGSRLHSSALPIHFFNEERQPVDFFLQPHTKGIFMAVIVRN